MKKGEIYEGVIERVMFPNKGIIRVAEETVIVKNGIPGQKIRFQIQKKRKNRLEGRLLDVLERSPLEIHEPVCSLFPACGGCMYQTMDYEKQLEMKEQQIRELLTPVIRTSGRMEETAQADAPEQEAENGNVQTGFPAQAEEEMPGQAAEKAQNQVTETEIIEKLFEGIAPSPDVFGYRNKMEYSFGDSEKDGPLTLGLHKKGSTYDVLTAADCKIVHEDFNVILRCVLQYFQERNVSYYHKLTHEGYLRHLLLRRSVATGEILAALVTSSQEEWELQPLVEQVCGLPLEGRIAGFLHIINDSVADVVKSDETRVLAGQDYFYEELLGLRFKITPFSFFQTNSRGAEVLYETVRDMIGDVEHATVFDLYSGTGTIAQVLSPAAERVIGVEIVEEAVEAARENAALNGLDNCSFLAGDVLKVLDEIPEKPDYIILDPPREGIHPKALPKIIDYGVERMVYVSCKPTSLARDLEVLLRSGYRVERVKCIDLFPGTVHTETVCLLSNRKSKPDTHVDLTLDMEDYYRIKDQEKQSNK